MVNFNGERYIGQKDLISAIDSFLKADYENIEFIFVDNGSDDDSIHYIREISSEEYKNVKINIVRNPKNIGFAGGCNEGIKYSKGEYICIVNNDDKALCVDWLTKLIKVLESNDKIGGVFSKKVKWDNDKIIDAAGLTMNQAGSIVQIGSGEKDEGQHNKIKECLIWQTPFLFKRAIIAKIGGLFDEDYVILNDDTDSSFRIWLAGYKIIYVPNSVVYHKRSATMKYLPIEFVAFHGRKNTIQTLIKNYDTINLITWLPMTFFIYSSASIYYIFIKRYDQARATTKAIFWNIVNIGITIKKRRFIQKYVRKIEDKEIVRHMAPFSIRKIISGDKVWPK